MRRPRIYINQDLQIHKTAVLPLATTHYLANVLRLRLGDELTVFNGQGTEYLAKLTQIHRQNCEILISEKLVTQQVESNLSIHLFQAVAKADKMDWIIQKTVELGVNAISPIITRYTDIPYQPDRLAKRYQHWQEIVIHACEQSGRVILPILHPPMLFADALAVNTIAQHYFLHPGADYQLTTIKTEPNAVAVWIGPEGGFAEEEIAAAKQRSWPVLHLGPRILRTETAAVVATALCQFQYGDLAKAC